MLAGCIVILAALIPFVLKLIGDKMAKDSTPDYKRTQANEKIDKIIASHNSDAATLLINNTLDKLQNSVSGNSR